MHPCMTAALLLACALACPIDAHAQSASAPADTATAAPQWTNDTGRIAVNAADAVAEATMVLDNNGLNPRSIESRIQATFGDHETGANGEAIVQLDLDGRSQLVYVAKEAGSAGMLRMRRIVSAAASIDKDHLEPGELWELMRRGSELGMGSWEAEGEHLLFVVKLPDSVDDEVLKLAILIAGQTADGMEQMISGNTDAY